MKYFRLGTTLFALAFCLSIMVSPLQSVRAAAVIGQKAPDFSLPDAVTNDNLSMLGLLSKHKAVVLIFMSTQCPYSNGYNTRFEDLENKYGPLGVAIVGINSNDTESDQDVVEHKFEHHFTFQIVKDGNNIVADKYGATHTPEVYLIDTNGNLAYHGRIDNSLEIKSVKTHDLADAIDDVLAGKPVINAETKAFGCTIKRVGM